MNVLVLLVQVWMSAALQMTPPQHRSDRVAALVRTPLRQSPTRRCFVAPRRLKKGSLLILQSKNDDSDNNVSDANIRSSSPPLSKIPAHLIPTLDLAPLMTHVASYACTKRGRNAIIDLAAMPTSSSSDVLSILSNSRSRDNGQKPTLFANNQRQRRQDWYDKSRQAWRQDRYSHSLFPPMSVAQSAEDATSEYELVSQAMGILKSQGLLESDDLPIILPLPPMFNLNDGVSSTEIDSDDDEWIDLCLANLPPGMDLYEEIDLETILKAEQVVKLLLETYEWAMSDRIQQYAPGLVDVVRRMELFGGETDCSSVEGNVSSLLELYQTLKGSVEIVRAGPSLSDINNRFSYQFQLAGYQELDKLKAKEEKLEQKNDATQQQLAIVQEELTLLESEITRNLIAAMIKSAPDVKRGMNALARLDAVFARASFGCDFYGVIPEIGNEGRVCIEKFMHPILALEKNEVTAVPPVVPVDLILPGKGGYQALLISGPNGGGKTLALKSFGLVAIMVKLGIPITVLGNSHKNNAVVDFFEDVLVEIGDTQSISKHESTLMARLNALSSLITKLDDGDVHAANLVLLDELGGGTDPVAGSALAQSILEKLMDTSPMCKLVATTHSPQLKSLSITEDRFECASVLMSNEKNPIFELSYGTTGQSFALEAARRCSPSLPEDVIDRAAELLNGGDGDAADSLMHYLSSLEEEKNNVQELTKQTEATRKEVSEYKDQMVSKIEASRMYLSRLESRLDNIFLKLKDEDTRDSYELVGDSLDELRVMKRKVQTEEDMLREKGLRRVPETYLFYEGENVVIIAEGEFKGHDAVVRNADDQMALTVMPVLDLFYEDESQSPIVLKRSEIAIFDYPDPEWGFSDDPYSSYSSSKKTSGSNVINALSKLDLSKSKTVTTKSRDEPTFISARQRKAAKNVTKQKKGKRKK